eukprot:4813181-Amphidinium_carterae.1
MLFHRNVIVGPKSFTLLDCFSQVLHESCCSQVLGVCFRMSAVAKAPWGHLVLWARVHLLPGDVRRIPCGDCVPQCIELKDSRLERTLFLHGSTPHIRQLLDKTFCTAELVLDAFLWTMGLVDYLIVCKSTQSEKIRGNPGNLDPPKLTT